jgi:flagellar M-ring protein FliF
MPDFIANITQNLAAMSMPKKVALMGAMAGSIAAIVALFLWTQAPKMELLYSNLSTEDVSAIVAKLKADNIPHQISQDKAAIFLPAEHVHETRLKLASEGLPGNPGVGFEIFDRSTVGVTEFVQKINYRRALQGELERTISQLEAVIRARVHIVMPEKSLFIEQQEKPRASVVVSLRVGKHLSDSQIQGIAHMVASSIDGLAPQDVTIVDGNGRMLSKPAEPDPNIVASNSQMEYKQNVERDLERKLQTMLERVVGHEKATVRVAAVLNFARVEHMEEKFDPDVQVPRSEQIGEEKLASKSDSIEAPPGVAANLPAAAQTEPAKTTTQTDSTKKNGVTNYEINKTTTRTIEPLGAIRQLSVAVLVDGTYKMVTAEGKKTRQYTPRSAEEMGKLETLVKNAMGFSAEREDQVSLVNIAFETEMEEDPGSKFLLSEWMPLIRYLVGFGLALALFFMVVRPIINSLIYVPPPPPPEELLERPAPKITQDEDLVEEEDEEVEGEGELGPGAAAEQIAEIPPQQRVLQLAKDDPQAAADIIKQMIKEST